MMKRNIGQLLFAILFLFLNSIGLVYAEPVRTDLSQIELLADRQSIGPGSTFNIVIELEPNEGWHAYWVNPGDAGLKLNMDWTLPSGFEVGELQFTTPHLIPFEEIVSYGYDGKVTVFAEAKAPDDLGDNEVLLSGNAFWLVCSDTLCVPQEATINLSIPVGEDIVNRETAKLVTAAKKDMPIAVNWLSEFYTDGKNFTVKSKIPNEYEVIESAYLFPRSEGMIENVYRQDLSFIDGEIVGRFNNAYGYEDNTSFDFVLTFKTEDGQDHAYALQAVKSAIPIIEKIEKSNIPASSEVSFLAALGFAFLGGLILNLMPCVFPILSLKAMSVVELSKKDVAEVKISGLLYTSGVIFCFAIIGAVVNLLSVGWGFHMQLPIINFVLGLLMIAIALNLFGLFEFGNGLMGLGQGLIISEGGDNSKSRRNTFFTGLLAVIVATPCTAPFMAGALGFAFITGGFMGMLIFVTLGFGLAFPYLLICFLPGFRNVLPKPGAWMENMRNILGFPMLATALWLFWILGNQIGVNAMAIAVSSGILLALALWSLTKQAVLWKVLSGLSVIGIFYAGTYLSGLNTNSTIVEASEGDLNAVNFSSNELQELVGQNKNVFVYFTADWCVTCKLNERVALSKDSVKQAFIDKDIIVMKADWTNQNPDITRTLQRYGRIGVPLYLYFPKGSSINNPNILPQILTENIVIEAL